MQYPIIEELTQVIVVLKNELKGSVTLDLTKFSISDVLKDDVDSFIIWNKFNDYALKICEKIEYNELKLFGFRQIEIIEIGVDIKELKQIDLDFLERNKIFDGNTKFNYKSTSYYYQKKNKKILLRIEPYLEDSKFLFMDLDVHFNQITPIQNLNELIKQEIKYFNIIKKNLIHNYVTTKP